MPVFIRIQPISLIGPVFISASLSGAGSVTAGQLTMSIEAALTGAGSLTGYLGFPIDAALTGTGTLTASVAIV